MNIDTSTNISIPLNKSVSDAEWLELMQGEIFFSDSTFNDALRNDFLMRAERTIKWQSPWVTLGAVKRLEPILKKVIKRGVKVCSFAREPAQNQFNPRYDPSTDHSMEAIERLRSLGVHVSFRERIHEKVVVVDTRYSYFGTLNVSSFNPASSKESMSRSASSFKAFRLNLLFALDGCPDCMQMREAVPPPQLIVTPESLGGLILQNRKAMDLSQEDLARLARLDKYNLGAIERGEHLPSIKTLFELGKNLQQDLLWLPTEATPFVEEFIRLFPRHLKKSIGIDKFIL